MEYGIPVEAEAFDMESNLVGSVPSEDIVTGGPVIIGLTLSGPGGGAGSEARMTKLTADNQKPLTL